MTEVKKCAHHFYNFKKLRVLEAFVMLEKPVTAKDISEFTGIEHSSVCDLLYLWTKRKYRYVRRLTKKTKGVYRYSLNATGKEWYFRLKARFDAGLDLVFLQDHVPQKVDNYIGITREGKEAGLTMEEALSRVGLMKDNTTKHNTRA